MVELHPNSNFNVKKKKDWQERKTLQTSFFLWLCSSRCFINEQKIVYAWPNLQRVQNLLFHFQWWHWTLFELLENCKFLVKVNAKWRIHLSWNWQFILMMSIFASVMKKLKIHFCQHNETILLDLVASINDLVNSRQLIFLEMCIAIYTSFWYTTSQKSSFDFRDQCFSNCNLHGRHLFFPEIIDRICYSLHNKAVSFLF